MQCSASTAGGHRHCLRQKPSTPLLLKRLLSTTQLQLLQLLQLLLLLLLLLLLPVSMDGWIDWQQVLCPTDVWCLQRCVWHDTAALCAIVSQAAVGLC